MARNQGRFQTQSIHPAAGDSMGLDIYGTGIYFNGKMYPILVDGVPLQPVGGSDTRSKSMLNLQQKALITKRPQQREHKKAAQLPSSLQFKAPGTTRMLQYPQQQLQPQFDQHSKLQQQQLQYQPRYQMQQPQQYQPHHQFQLQQQFVPHQQFRSQQQSKQQSKQQRHPQRQQQRQPPQSTQQLPQQLPQQQSQQLPQQQPQQLPQQQPQQQAQQQPQLPPQYQQQLMQQFYGNNMNAFNTHQNPSQVYNMNPNPFNMWPGYSMGTPSDLMQTFAIDIRPL